MISVRNLCKSFGTELAVNDVSFDVARGETLCLIGSSGSGKTTTLKMLNRLIEPTSGDVLVQQRSIFKQSKIALRRGMGYVIQQGGLFPHMTVAENIALLMRLEKVPRSTCQQRVETLLEQVQLPAHYARRYPRALSGGERQRVGVARALALKPEILLLDEPFGALDPLTRRELQKMILDLQREQQVTMIMVTHDLAEAFKCGHRIALMHQGTLRQVGTALDFIRNPASDFVKRFMQAQGGLSQLLTLPLQRLMTPVSSTESDQHAAKGAEMLTPEHSLERALALFLRNPQARLPVYTKGQLCGYIDPQILEQLW